MEDRTRLSGFHPYPAMVADDLAVRLARRHVKAGSAVLDPFCGSGRILLAGAEVQGAFVGIDVNPLACLITKAKTVAVDPSTVRQFIREIDCARGRVVAAPIVFREQRKVEWYSVVVRTELAEIVAWVNGLKLDDEKKTVVAAALSAAVRDASYCRKERWKLHRLGPRERMAHAGSAWDCLKRRLELYAVDAAGTSPPKGTVSVIQGEANEILSVGLPQPLPSLFDFVITSPPYGDSRTTVQYGAASSLCLDVVSHIDGLEGLFVPGFKIDNECLGGRSNRTADLQYPDGFRRYWAGARLHEQAGLVKAFLADLAQILERIGRLLKPGGRAVLILGRRSVGGFRVKLDMFAVDCMVGLGLTLERYERRALRRKRSPKRINRFGRARTVQGRAKGITRTMWEEAIVTFKKSGTPDAAEWPVPLSAFPMAASGGR